MAANTSFEYQTTVSSELPARYRYEHWLAPMVYGFEILPPNANQRLNFNGRVRSLITDISEIHDVDVDTFAGFLSESRIKTEAYEKLALLYVINGNISCRYKNDTSMVAKSGEFILFDARSVNNMLFENSRFVQLNLPRFASHNQLINKFAPSQLSKMVSDSGLAGILGTQLRHFNDSGDNLSTTEKLAFLNSTVGLALSVINSLPVNADNYAAIDKNSIFLAATQFIQMNLSLDSLSPESIAIALGCSRSTLYRAFAKQELLPADYIREQRLHRLAQLLQKPGQYISIAQLASECGLYDAPNLSRMFKRKYGQSPQEYRANYI